MSITTRIDINHDFLADIDSSAWWRLKEALMHCTGAIPCNERIADHPGLRGVRVVEQDFGRGFSGVKTDEPVRPLRKVERSLVVRALRALAYSDQLLDNHRLMARELADAIDEAGGIVITDSEGPY